jgi:hypothetical protein
LLLTGPLAVAGLIAVVWSGWHVAVDPAGARALTVADRIVSSGRPADLLTPESIAVPV